MSAETVMT